MRFIFVAAITGLLLANCGKHLDAPPCIKDKINELKAKPPRSSSAPAAVYEYEYQGKKTYFFPADCCDQFDILYDGECNYICSPSGGITGSGDRQCPDFYNQATLIRTVWKDPR